MRHLSSNIIIALGALLLLQTPLDIAKITVIAKCVLLINGELHQDFFTVTACQCKRRRCVATNYVLVNNIMSVPTHC